MTHDQHQSDEQSEATRTLLQHAHDQFGTLDTAPIVEAIRRSCAGADFSVQDAALDVAIECYATIKREGLHIVERPSATWRAWRVAGQDDQTDQTAHVAVRGVDPISASCSCADYLSNSLGLCKHVLLVLEDIANGGPGVAVLDDQPRLTWDPVHPIRGPFDRVARLKLEGMRVPELRGFDSRTPALSALSSLRSRHELLADLTRAIEMDELGVEPAAKQLVLDELRRTERERGLVAAFIRCPAALTSLKRRLYDYQRTAVLRFLRTGRLLLADAMGLGKTTQASAACHALLRTGGVKRVLLVVPTSLKPQWTREWRATTDEPLTVVKGDAAHRAAIYAATDRGALIVGYEVLVRDIEWIRVWAPEVVVLDEAQRIKNFATKSAAAVKSLSPRYRLALTGTPMENRLVELASIIEFVDDTVLQPRWRLVPFHTYSEGDGAEGKSGARNLAVLRARLAPVMMRRPRTHGVLELPARTDTHVPVEMTGAQAEEHAYLAKPVAALASRASKQGLTPAEHHRLMLLLTEQRIIANGLAQVCFATEWDLIADKKPTDELLAALFTPKLAALRALLAELAVDQRRKVVVFSQWRAMVRLGEWAVRDMLAGSGLRAAFYTGKETTDQRERALVDFHDDPNVAVLFLTDAGGTGLNLQHAGSACVQMELPWNPAVMEQRIARIHRQGQTQPVDVFHLVSENSIESRIASIIGQKRALFTTLFDGDAEEVAFDKSSEFLASMVGLLEDDVATPARQLGAVLRDDGDDAIADDAVADVDPIEAGITPLVHASITGDAYRVTHRSDGGLSVDVPPEMAAPLSKLLSSLAEVLRGASA